MMMSGISLGGAITASDPATAQLSPTDPSTSFASTFSGMTQQSRDAAQPAEDKGERADSKPREKDRDRDDRTDTTGSTPVAGATTGQQHADSAHAKDDKGEDRARDGRTVASSKGNGIQTPADAADPAIDTTETAVDTAHLAPVLDALKKLAIDAAPAPTSPAQAQQPAPAAAAPLPDTASLLAARIAVAPAEAKAAQPATKKGRADAAADKAAAIDAAAAPASLSTTQADAKSADATGPLALDAGQQLAAGGADRALDMAKQGAWLDGLARDIAATGDSASTLRFQAAPTHLGSVQVELARGLEGTSVTLTASTETARAALADAKPQLVAEARAQGIHIANAQVDVSTDSGRSGSNGQSDQRHNPRGEAGLSSQTGSHGGSGHGSQTRSQPFAVNQTSESQPVAPDADDDVASAAPADGMYA